MQSLLRESLLLATAIAVIYFLSQLWMAFHNIGVYDFPIFYAAAKHYITDGQLYSTILWKYYPAAPIYKFPPLFASLLVILIHVGASEHQLVLACFALQVILYASLVLILVLACKRWFGIEEWRDRLFYYYCLAILLACTCYPFIETLMPLQLESYNLALIVFTAITLLKRRSLFAGVAIGIGFLLKLYPALFVAYFVLRRDWRALGGFAAAILIVTAFTLAITGIESHVFYFSRILPTLLNEYPSEALTNISLAANMRHFYDDYWPWFSALFPSFSELPIKLIFRCIFLVFLIPVAWLVWHTYSSGRAVSSRSVLLEVSLFTILILMGLIDSWDNYQLLLLMPALICLACIFSEKSMDYLSLGILLLAWLTLWITAYPVTRNMIPADYIYQYVIFRGLTTYILFYCNVRLYIRLPSTTS